MPLPVHSIGSHTFVNMVGSPAVYGQVSETFGFPGVDSVDIRLLGKHSDQFTMLTVRDFLTIAAARTALQAYKDLVESGAQVVIWSDHNFSTAENIDAQVLEVRQVSLRSASAIVGGLTANSKFILRAAWRLIWLPQ